MGFWFGLLLALSLAAPPGPMNALIARHATRGVIAGVSVGVAAPIADTIYLVLALFVLGNLTIGESVLRVLALIGGGLMLWMAWGAWKVKDDAPQRIHFAGALALALLNPFQLAWWSTAAPVWLGSQGVLAIAGFLVGIYGWVWIFSALVAAGAKRLSWFTPALRVVSSVLLGLFAILMFGVAAGVRPLD